MKQPHVIIMHCVASCPSFTEILFNTLRLRQNGCYFIDDTFKGIFFNENIWILIELSLKFLPKGWINNIPALVQIIAWRRPGDKLLSEPMIVGLLTHICVTWPQWVNLLLLVNYRCTSTFALVSLSLLYPSHNEVVGRHIGFTSSVHPASRVRSVAPTVLVVSISYL